MNLEVHVVGKALGLEVCIGLCLAARSFGDCPAFQLEALKASPIREAYGNFGYVGHVFNRSPRWRKGKPEALVVDLPEFHRGDVGEAMTIAAGDDAARRIGFE